MTEFGRFSVRLRSSPNPFKKSPKNGFPEMSEMIIRVLSSGATIRVKKGSTSISLFK